MNVFERLLYAKRIAAHETGHVLLAWFSSYVREVAWVSLEKSKTAYFSLPRGSSEFLFDRAVICLAGIAGEAAVFGRFRSGPAAGDLLTARACAEEYRRTPDCARRLGRIKPPGAPMTLDFAAMFSDRPPPEVCRVLDCAYAAARDKIISFRDAFDRVHQMLLDKKELKRDEIAALFGPRPWAP